MSHNHPLKRADLIVADVHEQSIIYNSQKELIHVLNATAKVVWEMCDGQHTAEDMADRIRQSFAVPAERDILADVHGVLAVFVEKDLLAGLQPDDGEGAA